nr:hypothetical protein [Plantactinospora sp. KBS50]
MSGNGLGDEAVGADRSVAEDGHAVHGAADVEVVEVGRGEVSGGTVVSDRDGSGLPAEADGVLGADDLGEEHVEKAAALRRGESDDPADRGGVDVEGVFAGFGMNPDDGVDGDLGVGTGASADGDVLGVGWL